MSRRSVEVGRKLFVHTASRHSRTPNTTACSKHLFIGGKSYESLLGRPTAIRMFGDSKQPESFLAALNAGKIFEVAIQV
jgi:hypothetical protein